MPAQITTGAVTRKQKLQADKAQIKRMLRALQEYRQHPPRVASREYVNKLAGRHLVPAEFEGFADSEEE